ncbi:DUF5644 domain-containing protein [Helicobacter cinaedi]|uniref:DUF5644 domain-containing protein n=1 Tax=Helicobacter cinaedi TaxID=213 RepID=UPI000D7CA819|nr:DUF5644 domain-containing protein [Helicobacter cinaedi]BBB19863.1 hypothetical protein HC081234_10400 [Helicobacter cinaedi]
MNKVQLEVFAFEAGVDYLPYYKKLCLQIKDNQTLRDLLVFLQQEISGYVCDIEHLALRINGIAIFENLNLIDVVQRFGDEWQIEPISVYYAYKDLLVDKKSVEKKYDAFFAWADFLNAEEREELDKYLLLNLITPMSNDEYLGDGFFLYFKWLLSRHPEKLNELLEWIVQPQSGILNFVSLADMAYPRGNTLDEEMWELISLVLSTKHKQFAHLHTLKEI